MPTKVSLAVYSPTITVLTPLSSRSSPQLLKILAISSFSLIFLSMIFSTYPKFVPLNLNVAATLYSGFNSLSSMSVYSLLSTPHNIQPFSNTLILLYINLRYPISIWLISAFISLTFDLFIKSNSSPGSPTASIKPYFSILAAVTSNSLSILFLTMPISSSLYVFKMSKIFHSLFFIFYSDASGISMSKLSNKLRCFPSSAKIFTG